MGLTSRSCQNNAGQLTALSEADITVMRNQARALRLFQWCTQDCGECGDLLRGGLKPVRHRPTLPLLLLLLRPYCFSGLGLVG